MVAGSNPAAPACPGVDSERMQEMTVYGVSYDSVGRQPIVLLRTSDGRRVLPIWIGSGEANAILTKLKGSDPPRPMTHDLLQSLVDLGRRLGAARRGHRAARQHVLRDDHAAHQRRGRRDRLAPERRDRARRARRRPDLRRRGRDRGVGGRGRAPARASSRSWRTSGASSTSSRRTTSCATSRRGLRSARLGLVEQARGLARHAAPAGRPTASRSSPSPSGPGIRGHERVEQALLARRDRPSGSPGRACRRAARARARAAR